MYHVYYYYTSIYLYICSLVKIPRDVKIPRNIEVPCDSVIIIIIIPRDIEIRLKPY